MLCEKCKTNPATVFMTKIVNGVKTEVRLCPQCSVMSEMPISFDFFQGLLKSIGSMAQAENRPAPQPSAPCGACGMTYEQFKSCGKLGCAQCYHTFADEMETLLKNVHHSVRHEGKYPKRSGVQLRQKREAEQLRLQLQKAVAEENFEEAARLRDVIRGLACD